MGIRLRRTSGKTWAKLQEKDFFTKEFMDEIGKIFVKAVEFEARKDWAKQGRSATPRGEPEGLPDSQDFFKSFKYRLVGDGTRLELYSTWPQIEQIVEGRRPYPMTWLTQQEGVSKVPMKGDRPGTVLIRTTPKSPENAWIHPGFKKHNFIRRGYERARRQMNEVLSQRLGKVLSETPIA